MPRDAGQTYGGTCTTPLAQPASKLFFFLSAQGFQRDSLSLKSKSFLFWFCFFFNFLQRRQSKWQWWCRSEHRGHCTQQSQTGRTQTRQAPPKTLLLQITIVLSESIQLQKKESFQADSWQPLQVWCKRFKYCEGVLQSQCKVQN